MNHHHHPLNILDGRSLQMEKVDLLQTYRVVVLSEKWRGEEDEDRNSIRWTGAVWLCWQAKHASRRRRRFLTLQLWSLTLLPRLVWYSTYFTRHSEYVHSYHTWSSYIHDHPSVYIISSSSSSSLSTPYPYLSSSFYRREEEDGSMDGWMDRWIVVSTSAEVLPSFHVIHDDNRHLYAVST